MRSVDFGVNSLSAFWRVKLLLALTMAAIVPRAFATLGGNAGSVQSDVVRMQGSLRSTSQAAFTVHEIKAPTGTVVREYVSPGGTVFAVSWQGSALPNMRQLLGSYFEQYQQAFQSQASGRVRKPIHVEKPGLVVNFGGHMRSF